MSKSLPAKEKIIRTASRLFNAVGVHETGINRIIAESKVAKKSFYHHFPSKNKLIAEYFRRKDDAWFSRLEKFTGNAAQSPLEKILGIFDGLKEWYLDPDFSGCPFIKGLSDFGGNKNDKELVKCVQNHFEQTSALVEKLLKKARPKDYRRFIPQIMSLIAGATVVAHATGNASLADINKKIAKTLLLKK